MYFGKLIIKYCIRGTGIEEGWGGGEEKEDGKQWIGDDHGDCTYYIISHHLDWKILNKKRNIGQSVIHKTEIVVESKCKWVQAISKQETLSHRRKKIFSVEIYCS